MAISETKGRGEELFLLGEGRLAIY